MHGYDYEETGLPDTEQVIEEALGENPRARELHLMRRALEQRLALFRRERESAADERERATLNTKINELNKQIAALRQEEAISQFVEDSVRVTLHKPSLGDLEEG